MTTKNKNQESPENAFRENEYTLLSSEDRALLNQIASKEPPHSQRAQALLAIDEGATQAEAGRQAGLTIGQVRYWIGKFRKGRTSIFPEELLNQAQQGDVSSPEDADLPQVLAESITSPDVLDPEQAPGKEESQQEMPDAEDAPKVKKKPKKKSKKKSKKVSKSKKRKKTKRVKKTRKKKKPTKKPKKKKSKKAKSGKSKSSKKSKKKNKK